MKQDTMAPVVPSPTLTIGKLPDDLVRDILVRLPVNSLLRFKSVCKAWRAIISEPSFVRAHLLHSRQQRPPSFIITPILCELIRGVYCTPSTICFYRWQAGGDSDNPTHIAEFRHDAFRYRRVIQDLLHCDGLVVVPAATATIVLNPATRELLALPDNPRDLRGIGFGFGLDPSTNRYKVARCFVRSSIPKYVGMKVFTIGGVGGWRETEADPPYPIAYHRNSATFFKGYLLWIMSVPSKSQGQSRLLRFSLEDETFAVVAEPPGISAHEYYVVELDGELCISQTLCSTQQQVVIWVSRDRHGVSLSPQWDRRYVIDTLQNFCRPLAMYHREILLNLSFGLYCYNVETQIMKHVGNISKARRYQCPTTGDVLEPGIPYFCSEMSYTESLQIIGSGPVIARAKEGACG